MINGINHITITVNDIDESLEFYVDILDMTPHAKWKHGAYLTLNGMWFCLSLGKAIPSKDYCHLAFDVDKINWASMQKRLKNYGIIEWKENTSEGDSIYFLDPNGHKLELHSGNLTTRLESIKITPYEDLVLFNNV